MDSHVTHGYSIRGSREHRHNGKITTLVAVFAGVAGQQGEANPQKIVARATPEKRFTGLI